MKFIDSVKQEYAGVGGILETWRLDNGLYLNLWKQLDGSFMSRDELFITDSKDELYTKCIYGLTRDIILMECGGVFPTKIKFDHKYFDTFVSIVENLNVNDLTPDPFEG